MRFRRLQFHPRPLPARSRLPSSSPRISTSTKSWFGPPHSRHKRQTSVSTTGAWRDPKISYTFEWNELPEDQTFFDREIERFDDLLARRAFKVRLASVTFLPCPERTSMRTTGD